MSNTYAHAHTHERARTHTHTPRVKTGDHVVVVFKHVTDLKKKNQNQIQIACLKSNPFDHKKKHTKKQQENNKMEWYMKQQINGRNYTFKNVSRIKIPVIN